MAYNLGSMDNFTLAVVVADVVMVAAFIALIIFDKGRRPTPLEPVKPSGKRPA